MSDLKTLFSERIKDSLENTFWVKVISSNIYLLLNQGVVIASYKSNVNIVVINARLTNIYRTAFFQQALKLSKNCKKT